MSLVCVHRAGGKVPSVVGLCVRRVEERVMSVVYVHRVEGRDHQLYVFVE